MSVSVLREATRLTQLGKISESIAMLQKDIATNGNSYSLASNVSALYLQLGDYQNAIYYSTQAIALDPYSHIAYFNRFLGYLSSGEREAGWRDLRRALSCLYLVRGVEEQNVRMLNKSIQYCQQNARAYLVRARLNEGKNNKLVQNDYSAAIQYDPNLAEIYQQRALFFRKFNRSREFQEDLAIYHRIRGSGEPAIFQIQDNEQNDDASSQKEIIEQKVRQFQELLGKRYKNSKELTHSAEHPSEHQQAVSKLPLSSLQSRIEKREDDEMLLSDRPDIESTQTIVIKKEEINFRKRPEDLRMDKKFNEIFQDQSSKELNDKIARLEKEIKEEGGKIALEKEEDQLDLSDPSNFLTEEIEKAIKEIQSYGAKESLHEIKSAKSAGSQNSVGSKLSESKELTLEEFARYDAIKIEIVSLQDIENYMKKQTAKIQLRYGRQTRETSMGKFEWRQEFHFPLNYGATEVEVVAIQKGGIFKDNSEIGQGSVNLLETGVAKCILGTKQKKTAILYFKLSLV